MAEFESCKAPGKSIMNTEKIEFFLSEKTSRHHLNLPEKGVFVKGTRKFDRTVTKAG